MQRAVKTLAAGAIAATAAAAAVVLAGAPAPPAASTPTGGNLNVAAVPVASWVPWIQTAGWLCPQISPALLAAQLDAENGFHRDGVSRAGAIGPAQFLPATFAAVGRDDDHNGVASPTDIGDAIMAQGRYMCQLAGQVADVPGDPVANTLAAYNAGPARVIDAHGLPAIPETQAYVAGILHALPHYTDANTETAGRGCRAPLLGPAPLGTPLGRPGPAWHWYGRHTGQDYLAPKGATIVAACPGTITQIASGGAYGNHVIIDLGTSNGHRITMLYAHMSRFGAIRASQHVDAGTILGYVGQTGNAFGPHLHLEVRQDSTPTGPFSQFLDPPTFIDHHHAPTANTATDGAAGAGIGGAQQVQAVIAAAKSQLGVPYAYGGGTLTGPSPGIAQGADTTGWDCSSLVRYAWHQGSHGAVALPRTTTAQVASADLSTVTTPQPGDLLYFKTDSPGWDHVGLYLGDQKMLDAPHTGAAVRIVSTDTGYYAHLPRVAKRVTRQ